MSYIPAVRSKAKDLADFLAEVFKNPAYATDGRMTVQ